MNKEIYNKNDKDQLHGYQEWYHVDDITLWLRSLYENGRPIGYYENHDWNPQEYHYFNKTIYYIK